MCPRSTARKAPNVIYVKRIEHSSGHAVIHDTVVGVGNMLNMWLVLYTRSASDLCCYIHAYNA